MISLYVARDKKKRDQHDLGSILCLQVLNLIPKGKVDVIQMCDVKQVPIWLTGTPTLVSSEGEVYRGHQALSALQHMAVHLASSARKPSNDPPRSGLTEEVEAEQDPFSFSQQDPEDEEDSEMFTKKITQDDFNKMASARTQTSAPPSTASAPPPFKPMKD